MDDEVIVWEELLFYAITSFLGSLGIFYPAYRLWRVWIGNNDSKVIHHGFPVITTIRCRSTNRKCRNRGLQWFMIGLGYCGWILLLIQVLPIVREVYLTRILHWDRFTKITLEPIGGLSINIRGRYRDVSIGNLDWHESSDQPLSGVWKQFENVSIVYTWVNGSLPDYRRLRRRYGGKQALDTARDRDNDELKYSLRSVEEMMPWHKGKVYFVTPGHYPDWLNRSHPRVMLIHQEDIVPNRGNNLPTFSSNAIEPHLYLIPNLSDLFVYMNDDYILGKFIHPSALFTFDGGARFFFESNRINGGVSNKPSNSRIWLSSVFTTHALLQREYGIDVPRYFIKHAPFVFHKKAFEKIHQKWPKDMTRTVSHRFRHATDILTPLLHHYYVIHEGSLCCGMKYEKAPPSEMLTEARLYRRDKVADIENLSEDIRQYKPRFITINDGGKPSEQSDHIRKFLEDLYPRPSSFELRYN
jgi:hypothetical protein